MRFEGPGRCKKSLLVDQQSKQRITYRSFALAVAGEHPWLDRASTTM